MKITRKPTRHGPERDAQREPGRRDELAFEHLHHTPEPIGQRPACGYRIGKRIWTASCELGVERVNDWEGLRE